VQAILFDAKVVPDLVEEGLSGLFDHLLLRASESFVSALVDVDSIRRHEIVAFVTMREGNSNVKTEEIAMITDFGAIKFGG